MAQAHILHCLRDAFWLLPTKSNRATCFHCAKATTACADTPQDHKCGCFMCPAFAYIWAARLFTDRMHSFCPHQFLDIFVVFSLWSLQPDPLLSLLLNSGSHFI